MQLDGSIARLIRRISSQQRMRGGIVIVMKFGGTSLGDAERIRTAAQLVEERLPRKPFVVVINRAQALGMYSREGQHTQTGFSLLHDYVVSSCDIAVDVTYSCPARCDVLLAYLVGHGPRPGQPGGVPGDAQLHGLVQLGLRPRNALHCLGVLVPRYACPDVCLELAARGSRADEQLLIERYPGERCLLQRRDGPFP